MTNYSKNNQELTAAASRERLREWLIELISRFREELKKLSPEEQKTASFGLEDFSEPCQLLIVWAKEPEFQILLIVRSNDLEDRLIEIYGPVENFKLVEYIENEVLQSKIVKTARKERVENFLVWMLRNIRGYYDPLRGPLKSLIGAKTRVNEVPYTTGWAIIGDLQNFNIEEVVSGIIKDMVSRAKPPPPSPPEEKKIILEGFGTYVYPPIWIGEIPRPTSFREKISGLPFWVYRGERVIVGMYKNFPLIVTKDGYVAIGEKDKGKAQEFLNEIMSVLLLRGVPTNVIREVDLGEAKFTETGGSFSWSPVSARSWLYSQLWLAPEIFVAQIERERSIVNEENFRKSIELAEILTSDEKVKTLLLFHLEAYTYFINTEYKQSLLMGWIILEDFYIKDLWTREISKIALDKNWINALESWEVDQRLKALLLSHSITVDEYSLLMKIKNSRNEVVHEGKMPQKEIVEECLKFVSEIIRKYIGECIGEKLHEL